MQRTRLHAAVQLAGRSGRTNAWGAIHVFWHSQSAETSRLTFCHTVQMLDAEFLWIDTKGVDFKGEALGGVSTTGRFAFARQALDELDALSLITMAAQVAWEDERSYTPQVPDTVSQQNE
jgi:hypothetical protein